MTTDRLRVARWIAVALFFVAVDLAALSILIDGLGLAVWIASLIEGEAAALVRFLLNDRFVFGNRYPTLGRLWRYHVATAVAMAAWWAGLNVAVALGNHYAFGVIAGSGLSFGVSLASNFLWVWRRPVTDAAEVPSASGNRDMIAPG